MLGIRGIENDDGIAIDDLDDLAGEVGSVSTVEDKEQAEKGVSECWLQHEIQNLTATGSRNSTSGNSRNV